MTAAGEAERAAREALLAAAAEATGFSREAILPDAMRRVLARELAQGRAPSEVIDRARRGEPELRHALEQAVSVGETYFFRHPEQFELVARDVSQRRFQPGDRVRAWSAGCATGEETHSLAACLRACVPPGVTVEVLGTDLLDRNVQLARGGVYGRWSVRASGPALFPVHEPAGPGRVRVLEAVRQLSTFQTHNLLAEPPGEFDVVFCRNVLVYFSPEAGRSVVWRLARALAPGGLALFGPMDLADPPPGLVRVGSAELQAFRRPSGREVEPPKPRAMPLPAPPPPSRVAIVPPIPAKVVEKKKPITEPVALHLKALAMVDRGDDDLAATLLDELNRDAPAYVPALAERALIHQRQGAMHEAETLMRRVLGLVATLPPDELVAGPEPLPASFFAERAEAFLESRERP